MLIHDLTKTECEQVLKRHNLGRLACARNNQPYIVPIYFDYEDDHLYSFATLGQKILWMRANPRVCVEIDEITDQFHWTSVVILGRYRELLRSREHEELRARAQDLFKKRADWWYPAVGKTSARDHGVPVIFRIEIDQMSGRRAARDRAKVARAGAKSPKTRAPAWWIDVLRPRPRRTGSKG